MPLENTYLPGVPFALAGLHAVSGASIPRIYHTLAALSYGVGPAGLYVLCRLLLVGRIGSLAAALGWALFSASTLLYPEIRVDLGGVDLPPRVSAIVHYGEGPHNIGLALLPWSLALMARAILLPSGTRVALSLALASLVCLTNAFAAVTHLVAMSALVLAMRQAVPVWRRGVEIVFGSLLLYALVAGGLSPTVLATIRSQSQFVGGDYSWNWTKVSWLLLVGVSLLAIERTMRRFGGRTRFGILFLIAMAVAPSCHYWFGIDLVPQPHRYHAEVDLGFAFLFGLAVEAVSRRFPRSRTAVAIALLILAGRQIVVHRAYAANLIRSGDLEHDRRFAVAQWAQTNIPAGRMMVSGDTGFVFNLLATTLQTGSGHQPSTPNWHQAVGTFTIYSGMNAGERDADFSLLWLKAFGAKAVLVPGPVPGEAILFARPGKFDGRLPVLANFEGWKIYGTGHRQDSLFRVVPAAALVRTPPEHGLDVKELGPFVAALDAWNPDLAIQRIHPGHYRIRGRIPAGAALSVAFNYDPGWRANVDDKPVRVDRDGIGLIAIEPGCPTACVVDLRFRPGPMRLAARYISLVACVLLIIAAVWNPARLRIARIRSPHRLYS